MRFLLIISLGGLICLAMKKLILLIVLLSTTVQAQDSCFQEASQHYNVPESLLRAIAETESGNKSYALNIAGTAYYPNDRDEALKLMDTSKSFDVGIMQINRWWFDRFGYSYDLGLDSCWNIKMGAYILAYEISRHGYTWEAVGRYHSPTAENRQKYIQRLLNRIR
jgi:soluble lytic murein transglycosylase-like protein